MTSSQIRQSFLDFFAEKDHRIVKSAPVVPHGDPTLLFTNAGMNQFKDVFLGTGKRDYSRAVDTQKCIRVSGKHNDLEEVGRDTYHHTFFEMLGNWSFGDYYKKEAIAWAWELLTEVWGLPAERLYATVYTTDDEAYDLWRKYLPESQVQRHGDKDNFWEMGETGPCGPCSEIHYDMTDDLSGGKLVNADSPEVIEIWNLVFIQYNRLPGGKLVNLANKHVDTGMGFERLVAVLQDKKSNYDTDVFMPYIEEIEKLSGKRYSRDLSDSDGVAMRVIADHVRTLSFAIADGALPGNEGRGYVLRRILRRGSRFARNLGIKEPVIYKLVPTLVENMADVFPELSEQQETISRVIKGEEESFLQTLDRGIEKFEEIAANMSGKGEINGKDAFLLYDTFGFPFDLTQLLASEKGMTVDTVGYQAYMAEQKARSRSARKSIHQEVETPDIDVKTEFTGYSSCEEEAEVIYAKANVVVLDKTPFYAESGGQIADTGIITAEGHKYHVIDVRRKGDTVFHYLEEDEFDAKPGSRVIAEIAKGRRDDIKRNHSATHLLHEALRQVLGDHIQQAGSLVEVDYLRFDFNHFEKVSTDELKKIEDLVNKKILEMHTVETRELSIEEAQKNSKIKMFFGDKYGDRVRAVTMDEQYSIELCGGTHVANTSEIGLFKITSESSIASGVRRIEAVTGRGVLDYIKKSERKLSEARQEKDELAAKIKQLEKEIDKLKLQEMASGSEDIISTAKEMDGFKVIAQQVDVEGMDQLRSLADDLRNKMKSGIALLATVADDKVQLVCTVTDDLKSKYPAGKLVGAAAKVLGGGGGGKPHMATAGGKDISKLPELLNTFPKIIKELN